MSLIFRKKNPDNEDESNGTLVGSGGREEELFVGKHRKWKRIKRGAAEESTTISNGFVLEGAEKNVRLRKWMSWWFLHLWAECRVECIVCIRRSWTTRGRRRLWRRTAGCYRSRRPRTRSGVRPSSRWRSAPSCTSSRLWGRPTSSASTCSSRTWWVHRRRSRRGAANGRRLADDRALQGHVSRLLLHHADRAVAEVHLQRRDRGHRRRHHHAYDRAVLPLLLQVCHGLS